jgi:hypothetical protein
LRTVIAAAISPNFSWWTFNNLKFAVLQPFLPIVAKFSTFWPHFEVNRWRISKLKLSHDKNEKI